MSTLAARVPRLGRLAAVVLLLAIVGPAAGDDSQAPHRIGEISMPPSSSSWLIESYRKFLRDRDSGAFLRHVESRYTEGTLCRLTRSADDETRRASALALGLGVGGFGSNATVARMLKDKDPGVRALASEALWAIWSRADSPENNTALVEVQALIGRERIDEAVLKAGLLIERAPAFAEAYNQRAIAHFLAGRLEESVADCGRVLERNPFHFGALSGLGQCQVGLGRRGEAIRTFRRALDIQPYSQGLREAVAELEAAGD